MKLKLMWPKDRRRIISFDKVVNREVCRVTTKGTQTFSFLDGDATEAKSNYLLAVAEKVRIIYCESKYILQQREMILLLSFGHVSFNFSYIVMVSFVAEKILFTSIK
jgi:hypothetical protein